MKIEDFGPFKFARLGTGAVRDLPRGLDKLIAGQLWAKIVFALCTGVAFGFLMGPSVGLVPKGISNLVVA